MRAQHQLPLFVSIVVTVVCSVIAGDVQQTIRRQRVGQYEHGRCVVQGRYSRDMDSFNALEFRQYHDTDETWQERCRNCSCSVFGAYCTGPVCRPAYDFTQDKWCIRWSEDGCCCEELGCTVDGETYALGDDFPYGQGNPCLTCRCEVGTSREHCLQQNCGNYNRICTSGNVTYDDSCCPQYNCPTEPCTEIPDPNPGTTRHELLDWYGYISPIPVGTARYFHLDTWSTFICECQNGPMATCHMESY